MIGIIIFLFLIVSAIIAIQIGYNEIIYQQLGKLKWFKFLVLACVVVILALAGIMQIPKILKFPVIHTLDKIVNGLLLKLTEYINVNIVILWFVIPLALAFIFFIIKSIFKRISIKRDFNKSKENEKSKIAVKKEVSPEIINVPEEIEVAEVELEEPVNRFLDYPTTKIKYGSILGLQRAYEVSKEKGLIIDTTSNGYVAVFSSQEGMKSLKILLSENGIDISVLKGEPSVVLFDETNIESKSIKDELDKLNQKRREKRG